MLSKNRRISADAPPVPSLGARVRSTFVAPTRLVRLLGSSAPWMDVLLLSTAIAAVSVLAMPEEFFLDQMREAVTRRGDPVEITSSPEEVVRWGRFIGILATIATHPILIVSLAGLLTLIFTVLGQGRSGFREHLSLAAHGMLIPALGTAVIFIIRLVLDGIDAGILDAIGRPQPESSLLMASLSGIDPFTLWMLIVLSIGVNGFEKRHSVARAAAILIGGYLLVVLVTTALFRPEFA